MQHSVIQASQPYGLGLNETLLPQYLKQLGYATHAVGKVQITNSDNDKSCTFLPAVQFVTFLLMIILLTDVHVYTWAWFTKDRITVSNKLTAIQGICVNQIEIYPEASIIHPVNNQDMNDSYTPGVSMLFFHKQLPMM